MELFNCIHHYKELSLSCIILLVLIKCHVDIIESIRIFVLLLKHRFNRMITSMTYDLEWERQMRAEMRAILSYKIPQDTHQ